MCVVGRHGARLESAHREPLSCPEATTMGERMKATKSLSCLAVVFVVACGARGPLDDTLVLIPGVGADDASLQDGSEDGSSSGSSGGSGSCSGGSGSTSGGTSGASSSSGSSGSTSGSS